MRVFVYEFVTGGGLLDRSAARIPASLLAEGIAMRDALTIDFAALPDAHVQVLRDDRLPSLIDPNVDVIRVASQREHDDCFDACARHSDWSVIIAPELGGILGRIARRVLHVGGRLLGPSADVIALTADKHRLAEQLRAHGLPTPLGIELGPHDMPSPNDRYPAVLKPSDGCGSLGVQFIERAETPMERDPEISARWRLEEYVPGVPASVSLLCGPGVICALPACRQELSDDGRFTYLGGQWPLHESPTSAERVRLEGLAMKAVSTLGDVRGYIGVDLVLGNEGPKSRDTVIEINPRLTTSYVGLRAASQVNLAQAMLDAALGREPILSFAERTVRFNAAGETWHVPFTERAP